MHSHLPCTSWSPALIHSSITISSPLHPPSPFFLPAISTHLFTSPSFLSYNNHISMIPNSSSYLFFSFLLLHPLSPSFPFLLCPRFLLLLPLFFSPYSYPLQISQHPTPSSHLPTSPLPPPPPSFSPPYSATSQIFFPPFLPLSSRSYFTHPTLPPSPLPLSYKSLQPLILLTVKSGKY